MEQDYGGSALVGPGDVWCCPWGASSRAECENAAWRFLTKQIPADPKPSPLAPRWDPEPANRGLSKTCVTVTQALCIRPGGATLPAGGSKTGQWAVHGQVLLGSDDVAETSLRDSSRSPGT